MQQELRQSRNGAEQNIFNARLLRRRNGNAIAIATQTSSNPENVHVGDNGSLGNTTYLFSH